MLAVAVLFADTGSLVLASAETTAVSVSVVFLPFGSTVSVSVALPPLAIVPKAQITVPVEPAGGVVHEPVLGVALTKRLPVGTASVSETPVALVGPKFWIVMVNVASLDCATGF